MSSYLCLLSVCNFDKLLTSLLPYACILSFCMYRSAPKENSVSMSEVVQHSTAAASVAVALMNPANGGHRFRYLATKYSLEVRSAEGTIHRELSSVLNSANEIPFPTGSNPDECTIYCR